MTVEDLLGDLFYSLGKNTELDPYNAVGAFDIASEGAQRMLKWLNRGYQVILNWKMPEGTPVRFPHAEAVMHFQTVVVSGTLASATSTTATLDSSAGGNADQYNDWLLSIETGTGAGQVRMVVDYSALRAATVHTAWDTTPDSTSTYKLYKRFMKILNAVDTGASENITNPTSNEIRNPLKITDLESTQDLKCGGRVDNWPGNITSQGTPRLWIVYGNSIYFDYAEKTARWYRLEYEKQLPPLVAAADEPKIPEPWSELLFLWLLWKGRIWSHEPQAAYGAKRDLTDFIRMTKLPREEMYEREDFGAQVDLEG